MKITSHPDRRVIGDIHLFLPLGQDEDTLLFLDVRAQADTDSSYVGWFRRAHWHLSSVPRRLSAS